MPKIAKVLKNRTQYKDDSCVIFVQLEHGYEVYEVWVGGEVKALHHEGKNKAYVLPPWQRKNQSRKHKENA